MIEGCDKRGKKGGRKMGDRIENVEDWKERKEAEMLKKRKEGSYKEVEGKT